MSARIVPSVGRKVWFYMDDKQKEPIDATVVKVWDATGNAHPDSAVNLDTVDPDTGMHILRTSVRVGDETTPYSHYRWMPYQQGQAAKAGASS